MIAVKYILLSLPPVLDGIQDHSGFLKTTIHQDEGLLAGVG
jgi:hypothetical protein